MKTSPVTVADLRRSVLSVPPLCRNADLSMSETENRRMVQHLRAGGVTTHLWGGNANLYKMGLKEIPAFLKMAETIAEDDEWVIPSIGADFGKAMDQAEILSETRFPTAMILPMRFPADRKGVAKGIARIAEKAKRPLIIYYKDDGYLDPADLGALVRDGSACAVKYGTVRANPGVDAELATILKHVDKDLVISGIGERPIVDHAQVFGLRAFTSGCVCIAPRLSMDILRAITAGDWAEAMRIRESFMPSEDLRDRYSPLRVLHASVALSRVAATGPAYPMLSEIDDPVALKAIETEGLKLRAANDARLARAAE